MRYTIDYDGLSEYLHNLTYTDILQGVLEEAHIRYEVNDYKFAKKGRITLNQLIDYGDPFLVDVLCNDISVCIHTKRKYKLPTGRAVRMKLDRTIITDCQKVLGSPINGYWVIPEQFLTENGRG